MASAPASARDLYVDDDASKAGKGSKARPWAKLGAALKNARNGDTIHVAAGQYRETLLIRGKALELLGGYGPRFEGRDPRAHATRILGDGKDAVLTLISAHGALVDGFVISGGGGSGRELPHYVNGGGVYISGGEVTLSHNTIEKNSTRSGPQSAERSGGGIFATGGKITLVANIVRANTSRRGGGVAIVATKVARVERNRIEKNISEGDHGGGLYFGECEAIATRNIIVGNEVGRELGYGWGGGVLVSGKRARVTLTQNTIRDNYAHSLGSGVFIDDEAEALLKDELIVANRCAAEGGSAVYVDGLNPKRGSKVRLERCTIVEHPCKGARGGQAVRVEQGSQVTITRSVFWHNESDFSTDATSRIKIEQSLTAFASAKESLSATPRFSNAAKGDYRLVGPAGAMAWGVSWGPKGSKPLAVALVPPKAPRSVSKPPPPKVDADDCATAGAGGGYIFGLMVLALWGRRRRRSIG